MEQNLFIIGYGLAGGYGGIHDYEVIKADNLESADNYAFLKACEYYESYIDGTNLREVDQIMEEEDLDEESTYDFFMDERESWIDYIAMEYNEKNLEKLDGCQIWNPFSQ